MAQAALQRRDERTQALVDVVSELASMDEPRKRLAGIISGLDIRYDLGEGHPLLGRRMPDLDLVTADGPLRVFELLHGAQPVLLNLGEPDSFDITPWADRVQLIDAGYDGLCELPVLGAVTAPTAVLIGPDGYVAWVGAPADPGLPDARTSWFGAPTTERSGPHGVFDRNRDDRGCSAPAALDGAPGQRIGDLRPQALRRLRLRILAAGELSATGRISAPTREHGNSSVDELKGVGHVGAFRRRCSYVGSRSRACVGLGPRCGGRRPSGTSTVQRAAFRAWHAAHAAARFAAFVGSPRGRVIR